MVYVAHHAIVLVGCLALLPAVHRRAWARARPSAAVALWQLLLLGAILSAVGLLVSIAMRAVRLGVLPAIGRLSTSPSVPLTTVDLVVLGLAGCLAVAIGVLHISTTARRNKSRDRHRTLLDVVGDCSNPEVTIVDHRAVAVYAVPGRSPRIVATSAAVDRLTPYELRAVLAHERGHLASRHDVALLPFSVLRRAFPRWRVAGAIEAEVSLLLELCADRAAVREGHGPALHTALLAVTATPGQTCADPAAIATRLHQLDRPSSYQRLAAPVLHLAALSLCATTLSLYLLPS